MSTQATPRPERELIRATSAYAQETRWLSWLHLLTTLGAQVACMLAAAVLPSPWLRLGASVLAALFTARSFIIFHDFKHGAILRGSTAAALILDAFGLYVLTPSTVWTQTHNYHHSHTAKLVGSHVGSYMMVTPAMWEKLTAGQRFMYKLVRHPLTILLGYFTVFMYGFCVAAFLRNPRKHPDALLALLLQLALIAALWWALGFETTFYALLLPQCVAHALGAYLFYAQHNFPEVHVQPRESWTFARASLESSSYMKLGPLLNYFTGNIGYHHVHHLNHRIPFYRLPEAMAGIPELQQPLGVTSLQPRDIVACLRLKLWDPDQNRMVGFPRG